MIVEDKSGIIGPSEKEIQEFNNPAIKPKKAKSPLSGKIGRVISSFIAGIGGGLLIPTVESPMPQIQAIDSSQSDNTQFLASQGIAIQERKAEASSSLIRNEASNGPLHIDLEVLNLMDRNIRESGLSSVIGGIIVRDMNDPIFTPSEIYGPLISGKGLNKFSAGVVMEKNKDGIYELNIYIANTVTSSQTVLHEIGHLPDWIVYLKKYPNNLPEGIKKLDLGSKEIEDVYHNRFIEYLQQIPSGELKPFSAPYEKQIVMGKSIELGSRFWPNFLTNINGLDNAYKFAIPRSKLTEVASKTKPGLSKMALDWYIQNLEQEEAKGKKRITEDSFSEETWGRFLFLSYYQNKEMLRKQFPDQFNDIERDILNTESRCRMEEWADIWALRVLNRENAVKIDKQTVEAQEKIISLLTAAR